MQLAIYGDKNVPNRTFTGRPTVWWGLGDSIILSYWNYLARVLDNVVGVDDAYCNQGFAPSNFVYPATVNYGIAYNPRQSSGSSTLNGATSISAASLVIAADHTANSGQLAPGMILTIDTAGNQETITVSAAYAPGNLTVTFNGGALLTKAHSSGVAITWTRPSGVASYCGKQNFEYVLNTGTAPTGGAWNVNRIVDYAIPSVNYPSTDLPSGKPVPEWYNWKGGSPASFGKGPVTVTLYHLAGPTGCANNVFTLWGNPASVGLTGQQSIQFNSFNATPIIRAVTVSLGTPANWDQASAPRMTVTMNAASGGQALVAGQTFIPLAVVFQITNATSGLVLHLAGTGGFQLQDYDGTGAYGPAMTPTFAGQYASTAGIDTLYLAVGTNNPPAAGPFLAGLRQVLANVRTGNPAATAIGVITHGQVDVWPTTLTAQASAGAATLAVASASGIAANGYIILEPGTGNEEKVFVDNTYVSGLSVPLAEVTTILHANASALNILDARTSSGQEANRVLRFNAYTQWAADAGVFVYDMSNGGGGHSSMIDARYLTDHTHPGEVTLNNSNTSPGREWVAGQLAGAMRAAQAATRTQSLSAGCFLGV